jgi:hypothetical protein
VYGAYIILGGYSLTFHFEGPVWLYGFLRDIYGVSSDIGRDFPLNT